MSIASEWLYSEITGDTEITAYVEQRVYKYVAPEGTAFPFIVFHEVTGSPVSNYTADRIGDRERWIIKVYDKGSSDITADTIDRLIRSLLHKSGGDDVIYCVAGMRRTQADFDANKNPIRGIIREYEIYTQE